MAPSRQRVTELVNRLAAAVAATFTLVLTVGYFALEYEAIAIPAQIKAQTKADLVSQIAVANPDFWMFQEHRLQELLMRSPALDAEEQVLVLDASGRVVVSVGTEVLRPMVMRSHGIFDSGRQVGLVKVRHTLLPEILHTVAVGILGMILGAAVFVILRVLPLRALDQAMEALRQEKERAQVTLASIGDAVISTDALERVDFMNPVAEQLTGWGFGEARGRQLREVLRLVDDQTLESVPSPVARAMAERRAVPLGNHVALVRRNGERIRIEDSAAPIFDAQNQVAGVVLVFRDVTRTR